MYSEHPSRKKVNKHFFALYETPRGDRIGEGEGERVLKKFTLPISIKKF